MESKVEIQTGAVTTIKEHFESNPQSVAIINGDPNRRGVIINGEVIEIGSPKWEMIKNIRIYNDQLLGELRILYNK